jgi:protein-disulfide isomerase
LSFTRRGLLGSAGAVALAAGTGATIGVSRLARAADDKPLASLMDPGPFPDLFLGSAKAPLIIVEYASMTCTHCAQFAITTFPEVKSKYIESGKVRYAIRDFPLDPLAAVGAMLARSNSENYYKVIDILLREQRQWIADRIQPLMTLAVEQLGFTPESFKAVMADAALLEKFDKTIDRAKTFGVNSVPCFFIKGRKVAGFMSMRQIEELIEA